MRNCWDQDPKARPTFTDLAGDLNDILDWDEADETDTLYVNVEPYSPPTTPVA